LHLLQTSSLKYLPVSETPRRGGVEMLG